MQWHGPMESVVKSFFIAELRLPTLHRLNQFLKIQLLAPSFSDVHANRTSISPVNRTTGSVVANGAKQQINDK